MTEHFLAPTRQLTSQAWERTAPMPALPASPLRTLVVVPLLALAILAAAQRCSPRRPTRRPPPKQSASRAVRSRAAARQQKVLRAASVALHQIGDPYRYGAAGPGLLRLLRADEVQLREGRDQAPAHRRPPRPGGRTGSRRSKLRRGDLMFFTDGGGVYHAAMFLKWKHGPCGDGALPRQRPARTPRPPLDQAVVRRDACAAEPAARTTRSHDTIETGVRGPTIRP